MQRLKRNHQWAIASILALSCFAHACRTGGDAPGPDVLRPSVVVNEQDGAKGVISSVQGNHEPASRGKRTTSATAPVVPRISVRATRNERLFLAASEGRLSQVVALLAQGVDINALRLASKSTVLFAAVANNDARTDSNLPKGQRLRVVKLLLKHGADPNIPGFSDGEIKTPLRVALEGGVACQLDSGVVLTLVKNGARVSGQELKLAALTAHPRLVESVLKRGVAVDAIDDQGRTALLAITAPGKPPALDKTYKELMPVVRLLLRRGASVNVLDREGKSPLIHVAASWYLGQPDYREESLALMRLLLKYGAEVNSKDKLGWTPLMHVCAVDHAPDLDSVPGTAPVPALELLIKHGASLNLQGRDGTTALKLVARRPPSSARRVLLTFLQQHGAKTTS